MITDFVEGVDKIKFRTADNLADLHVTDLGATVRISVNAIHAVVANIEISESAILPNVQA